MRRFLFLLLGLTGLVVAGLALSSPAQATTTTFVAGVAGANEVPPRVTNGNGVVEVTIDDTTYEVCVDASDISGLSGPIVADHIHQAAAGVNGSIVVDFGGQLVTCVTSDATTVNNILADPAGFYVNFHTSMFPGGEVRGQLGTSNVTDLETTASGTNEVPANATTGGGPVTLTVDSGSNEICLDASGITGLTGPLVADHIHQAVAGVNGSIVVDFGGQLVTCVIADATVVAGLVADPAGFYVNFHTSMFPGGEVRGQLALQVEPTTTTTTTTPTSTTGSSTTQAPANASGVLPASAVATPITNAPSFTG